MKPSVQAEKHLAKNYPISCRPELHQAAGRGTPQLGPQASDDAVCLAELLRERAVQVRAGVQPTRAKRYTGAVRARRAALQPHDRVTDAGLAAV